MTDTLSQAGTEHSMLYVPYVPSAEALLRGNCLVSSIILDFVGDPLCTRSPDGEVRLHLLENCLHAPDGITHRFKLKKGITFHDGTEVTANDIVTMLTGPMPLAIDPSHYIATIKRTSRYGFDITTTERGVDLLGYLAHKAFTVRASAADQAGGYVFTGKFKIEAWTPRIITFSAHKWQGAPEEIEQAEAWRLKLVAIGASGIDLFHNHPFSYAYLGHIFKEKPVGQLSHIKTERTESGCSYLIALRPDLQQREYIKERLTLASYIAFSRDRSFQRIPLESFFPKKHPLYAPFQKPARSAAQPAALRITLSVTDPTLSDKLLGIYHTACLNQGIHVTFTRDVESGSDGSIHGFFNNFQSPAFDAMEFFGQEPLRSAVRSSPRLKELWRKVIKTPLVAKQERLLMTFLKDLAAAGPFVPLFYSFFVVKTNMPVTRKSSYQITLDFNTNLGIAASNSRQPVNADLEQFKTEALASLGQAIQMFAHDVKKPFSMMYSMLSLMANIEDGDQLKSLSRRYVSDVRGTMDTVTTMLSDIVEIGSDTVVHKESHSLRAILASVLWEVFAYSSDGPVALHYELQHYHKLQVDAPKITRVLSNVLVNACQAMAAARQLQDRDARKTQDFAGKERITFTTKEVLHGKQLAVQLAIHNTGSVIPKDRLDAVFNLFFTQGKAKGTGLGLAICKKIILEHGGKIWAQSRETDSADQPAGTTFLMILPIAIDQMEDSSLRLPTSSAEFAQQPHTTQPAQTAAQYAPSSHAGNQEDAVPDVLSILGRAIKILIVDDEPMYLTLFSLLIESTDELSGHVQLHTAKNAFQALTMTEHIVPDIIVMDIDLGKLSDDGFEVVRKIRARGHKAKICIHSNRSWQDDQHLALKAEADFFLPKPMTKANIIRLIANGLTGQDAPSAVQPAVLALLDDDPFVHDMLSAASHHLPWTWHSYTEAAALLTDLAKDIGCPDATPAAPTFDAVLIDYYLGSEGDQGPEVARKVRQLQPSAVIVLITDSPVVDESERSLFDAVLTKDAQASTKTLLNLLTSRDKTTDTQKN